MLVKRRAVSLVIILLFLLVLAGSIAYYNKHYTSRMYEHDVQFYGLKSFEKDFDDYKDSNYNPSKFWGVPVLKGDIHV